MKVPVLDAAGRITNIVDSKELTAEEWARVRKDKSGALRPVEEQG